MPKPLLRHIANLWTFMGHPTKAAEWSLDEKLRAMKEARARGATVTFDVNYRQRLWDAKSAAAAARASSCKRSTCRCTLPVVVIGSASMNSISFGYS